jgi:2-polyprenyl-3-methyl-5-hydroxy-6-metoxy-1,4-benzoquinol methylase
MIDAVGYPDLKRGRRMSDFRASLYNRYVTTFKEHQLHVDDASLRSYWAWCDHKFLPLLKDLEYDAAILDLGCGPGYMMEFLEKRGYSNVRGIDISEE